MSHEDLLRAVETEVDTVQLAEAARSLHPADLAMAMEEMDQDRRRLVFSCLDDSLAAEVLDELAPYLTPALLADLPLARASDIVEEMPADEAADLLGELPAKKANAILGAMERDDARDVRDLLDYESDTAGGQMTTEFVAVDESWTAEETILRLRELAPEAETIYHLFVVDSEDRLTGILSLRSLIVADPRARVSDVMSRDVISVSADADQEEAADIIARYNLVAVPVVDGDRRPIGIITVDDAVDVIEEEASEDVYGPSGSDETSGDSLGVVFGRRLVLVAGPAAGAIVVGLALWVFLESSVGGGAQPPDHPGDADVELVLPRSGVGRAGKPRRSRAG